MYPTCLETAADFRILLGYVLLHHPESQNKLTPLLIFKILGFLSVRPSDSEKSTLLSFEVSPRIPECLPNQRRLSWLVLPSRGRNQKICSRPQRRPSPQLYSLPHTRSSSSFSEHISGNDILPSQNTQERLRNVPVCWSKEVQAIGTS